MRIQEVRRQRRPCDRDAHVIKKKAGSRPAQQQTREAYDNKRSMRWQEKHEMTIKA